MTSSILPGPEACSFVASRLSFCESASPGFHTFTSPSQAPCLCYSTIGTTTLWVPNPFDDAVYTCEIYEQFSVSTIHALGFFCGTVGNVLNQSSLRTPVPGPATTTAALWTTSPITPPTVTTSVVALTAPPIVGMTYPPCAEVASLVASCISATTMFTDLNSGHQALCLCWRQDPPEPPALDNDQFDVPMLSCANYLQTANPSFYSDISTLEGFCTNWNGIVQSLLPAISYKETTIFLNTTTINNSPSTTANPITANPSIASNTPASTAISSTITSSTSITTPKPNTSSSLHGGISTEFYLALAAVAFAIVLCF